MTFKEPTPNDFPFGKVLEDFNDEQWQERITKAFNWQMPTITTVPYVGGIPQHVQYKYPELTARCPVTGIQDLYTVTVDFVPRKHIPELKSLKLYYMAYRDLPISHEHLQAKVYKDFQKTLHPRALKVTLDVAVRGGIYTKIEYGDLKSE